MRSSVHGKASTSLWDRRVVRAERDHHDVGIVSEERRELPEPVGVEVLEPQTRDTS